MSWALVGRRLISQAWASKSEQGSHCLMHKQPLTTYTQSSGVRVKLLLLTNKKLAHTNFGCSRKLKGYKTRLPWRGSQCPFLC